MSDSINEKIKKLLRLANSSNENEAKLAMKKAQELLAKHKLEMADADVNELTVEELETGVYYSHQKDLWKMALMDAISKNYCVENYVIREYHSSRRQICLIGTLYDMEICMDVFNFASAHVEDWYKTFKKEEGWKYSAKYLRALKNTYGIGFAEGVSEVLERQKEQKKEEWGIVMATPKEAKTFVAALNETKSKANFNVANDAIISYQGYAAGVSVELSNKLTV